jgi:N-acyl-D-aspartate/D-glutamate deacylase
MAEEDICAVMSHEVSMIGSDGLPSEGGQPHPRLYGTFPRVLGRYVRELGVLALPEAVRKMTSLPARKFRLGLRGQIRTGWFADLCLFEPEKITDRATYDNPRLVSAGVSYVIVNGVPVISNGDHLGTRSGYVLNPSEDG